MGPFPRAITVGPPSAAILLGRAFHYTSAQRLRAADSRADSNHAPPRLHRDLDLCSGWAGADEFCSWGQCIVERCSTIVGLLDYGAMLDHYEISPLIDQVRVATFGETELLGLLALFFECENTVARD
jgi:hypothetical protein